MRLFASAAAAQAAGFRACKRCEPDAAPGSPAWNRRADVAGRAVRLIADGDRGPRRRAGPGVPARLQRAPAQPASWSPRWAPARSQLARAQRAQAARTLIESTGLRFAEVALAAGFGSVRQFNDTIRAIYARTPGELRRRARRRRGRPRRARSSCGCPARAPLDGDWLLCVPRRAAPSPASRTVEDGTYRRSLALEHGGGLVALTPEQDGVRCVLRLDDLRDLTAAVARCRRLLDLDADPVVDRRPSCEADPLIGEVVRERPGMRVPGCVDGFELATRAIVGQQVSVAAAAHRARAPRGELRRAARGAGRARSLTASPPPRRSPR